MLQRVQGLYESALYQCDLLQGMVRRRGYTTHSINLNTVEKLVLEDLKHVFALVKENKAEFVSMLQINVSGEIRKALLAKTVKHDKGGEADKGAGQSYTEIV